MEHFHRQWWIAGRQIEPLDTRLLVLEPSIIRPRGGQKRERPGRELLYWEQVDRAVRIAQYGQTIQEGEAAKAAAAKQAGDKTVEGEKITQLLEASNKASLQTSNKSCNLGSGREQPGYITQYATSSAYLCNALMVFEALQRLGSRAQRVLFYPEDWDVHIESDRDRDSQLLSLAREKYNVQLVPIDVKMIKAGAGPDESWDKSISKLLVFGETEYDRIIHIDSDVNVLQNMDELFFLPSAKVAMPRAYWRLPDEKQLSSLLIVIEPSYREFSALMDAARPDLYDMELLNDQYGDSAIVLPHRQYGLITGEFRAENHKNYLGNEYEIWDPDKVLSEAKLVHFSDWPLPKPWVMWPQKVLAETLPKCQNNPGTPKESGCRNRELWRTFYDDFRRRRKNICKLLSYPAPDIDTDSRSQ
ncbi:N-acetylglucosaminyltransferase [Aspergillus tanneri]|uniref:N-acetylglucosaminyltransferase n=1 Tax=Aspergillus tanneri TaxID=1220188 RepID=A0A5M9MHQ1_9EURO|nr:N-acetylglucosaminyltransferase [Aspergillus tanneri]KAA8644890.1 N-acetylglucosaminyltransferase [Aspergillus tanneri]